MNHVLHIRRVWRTVLVALALGNATAGYALDPSRHITQYGHDLWLRQNGLPANAVNACLQTRDGYLWIGTSAGLFRFDGVSFRMMPTDSDTPENRESIATLLEGNDSSLWVGTTSNGIRRIKGGTIVRYGEHDGLTSSTITVTMQARDGTYWLGTSYGLYRFSGSGFTSVPISPNSVTAITQDSSGIVWVGTQAGIRAFVNGQEVAMAGLDPILAGRPISALMTTRKGDVWVGTREGLSHWQHGVTQRYSMADGISDASIVVIAEDRDGNLWVGTSTGGINRFARGAWSAFTTQEGLGNGHVLSLCEDREGSLWIGTMDGLDRLRNVNIMCLTSREGLADDYVSGIAETPDGTLYFLGDQGASITCLKDGRFTKLKAPTGPAFVARDGSLWIGQTGTLLHVRGTSVTRLTTRDGIPNRWITAIGEDNESLLIAFDGLGIRRYVNGRFLPLTLKDGTEFPPTTFVGAFYQEPNGTLWIGRANGPARLQNGVLETFNGNEALTHFVVSAIYDDLWGSLWFSSPRSGLARYRDGKFTLYSTKDGLFSNELYCVLGDGKGDLWLSSPRGIGRLQRADLDAFEAGRAGSIRTDVFLVADGLKTDECSGGWQPAGCRSDDGHLWFATKKGAVSIDPQGFTLNPVPPPVCIEKGFANQQPVAVDDLADLPPGVVMLEFHYTALSYLVPERVLFRYMLEGYDKNWVNAGTRRVAYYTGVPPGTYRFRVIACNNDGIWNDEGASVVVDLAPRYYQTLWFFLLVVCLLIVAAAGLYRLRVRALRLRELQLEEQVQLRTKELQKQRSFLRQIIDLNPGFIFAKDMEGRFTLANRAIAEAYGVRAEDLIGKTEAEYSKSPEEVKKFQNDDLQVMLTKTEKFIPEEEFTDSAGGQHWMQMTKIPIISENGLSEQILGVAHDITERKRAEEQINASLREKEVLLKEIHHRVKNNLQIISSLLSLQEKQVKDRSAQVAFEESRRRIRTMAIVHEELYRSRNIADINLAEQIDRLVNELMRSFGREGVTVVVNVQPILLQIDKAIPCGLIVNELVTNACKHAFPGQRKGTLRISLHRTEPSSLELSVADDGVGFPDGVVLEDVPSMGMSLVVALTQQLSGTLTLSREKGTTFTVRFPL